MGILLLPEWLDAWESLAVTTKAGTVLELATLKAARHDLESYLLMQRTGIMPEAIRFPWNKVLAATNQNVDNPDIRKVMTYVEKSFNDWRAARPTGTSGVELDDTFKKEAGKTLHAILKASANSMRIERLTMAYALKTEKGMDQETLDDLSSQIRAYTQQDDHFHISRGPMGSVYRVKDEKGKETHVVIAEPATGATGGKVPERYTAAVKALGFSSKAQFERAKTEGAKSFDQLKEWVKSHS